MARAFFGLLSLVAIGINIGALNHRGILPQSPPTASAPRPSGGFEAQPRWDTAIDTFWQRKCQPYGSCCAGGRAGSSQRRIWAHKPRPGVSGPYSLVRHGYPCGTFEADSGVRHYPRSEDAAYFGYLLVIPCAVRRGAFRLLYPCSQATAPLHP